MSPRAWALLDAAAATLVAAALAVMVGDQVLNDAFVPGEYFAYFTIQTSIAVVTVLALGAAALLRAGRQSPAYATARACMVAYAAVTGVVYNALLRGIEPERDVFVTAIGWPNEVVHVVAPAYLVLEWVLHRSRARPGRRLVAVGLAYPVVWVVLTLLRGTLDGFYPYPFIDPAEPAGWPGVGAYVLGIAAFVAVLLILVRLVARSPSRDARRAGGSMGS